MLAVLGFPLPQDKVFGFKLDGIGHFAMESVVANRR